MPTSIQNIDSRLSANGSIYFELEQITYFSGQKISGNIYIDLKEQYQGSALILSLEGIEEVNRNSSKIQKCQLNRILRTSKIIYDFSKLQSNNILSQDIMKIKFDIDIPKEFPSQVNIFYDYESCFRINYYLCAYIIPVNNNQKPIQGIQRVLIFQDKSTNDTPICKVLQENPRHMLFLGLGQYNLKLLSEKQNFYPGEQTTITIDYDFSQFIKEISHIKIDLIGQISKNNNSLIYELNILSTEFEVKQKKGIEKQQIFIPITCPISTHGQFANLDFFFQLTPVIKSSASKILKPLTQSVTIYSNQIYLKNIHLPIIKLPKLKSQKQITNLTNISLHQVEQNNNNQFQAFTDTQQEYLYYYEIEKNFST